MSLIITRRTFLKIASSVVIATPIIARAALTPTLKVPGIARVDGVTRRQVFSGSARFANAVFTPGNIAGARELIQMQVVEHLPYDTRYEIRAVPLDHEEMKRESSWALRTNGYAVLWVTDAHMQSQWDDSVPLATYHYPPSIGRAADYWLLGRFVTGQAEPVCA